MDRREDVAHLVTFNRRDARGTKGPGELAAGWAVRVSGQVAARQMREEGVHLLRGSAVGAARALGCSNHVSGRGFRYGTRTQGPRSNDEAAFPPLQ